MAKPTSKTASKKPTPKPKAAPVKKRAKATNATTAAQSETPASMPTREVAPGDRERMIQYAAYHIAEKDGFKPGKEQDYWFQAEQQVSELLKGQPGGKRTEVH